MNNNDLNELLKTASAMGLLQEQEISDNILNNIKYELRDYQEETLKRFIYYIENTSNPAFQEIKKIPTHLLFNLATGAGKTLLMAGLILYYYEKGYRNFLFFVNQTNLVSKTVDNLCNSASSKYLFKQSMIINGRRVQVKQVTSFNEMSNDIQIQFSTIQGLQKSIEEPRENSNTLENLTKQKVVMISDECHHLNASTKKLNKSQQENEKSWEYLIINKILHNDTQKNNVLLEFTATVPHEKEVIEKYNDKKIIDLDLKEFRNRGFTKDVNLLYASFDKKQRILTALLFNWYREQIAINNNIDLKPVILFKSKTIDESRKDFEEFHELIDNLNENDFTFLEQDFEEEIKTDDLNSISALDRIKNYISTQSISIQAIINSIKNNFQQKYCIITNSKDNAKTTQEETTKNIDELLNSLENKNNSIRAIFTVKKLEEGWDVLNLYDIVRLYEGQSTGGANKGKSGSSTVSEVQLIGRGVRYYPFNHKDTISYKRKFDDDKSNELRILEEFHFHSTYQSSYIVDLKNELRNKGLINEKTLTRSFHIKEKIRKKSPFYKNFKIVVNQRVENPNKRKKYIKEIVNDIEKIYTINSRITEEKEVLNEKSIINNFEEDSVIDMKFKIKDYKNVVLKVFSKSNTNFYTYQNLKHYLDISSIDDIFNDNLIGNEELTISSNTKISQKEIYNTLETFLKKLEIKLKEYHNPYVGTKLEFSKIKDEFSEPKYKNIDKEREQSLQYINEQLKDKDWYVMDNFYGNNLEEEFTKFFNSNLLPILKEKGFDEVYFLRNEEVYKIFDFDSGRGFQPDFLLFVKRSNSELTYQCFFEVKGNYLSKNDIWKQQFMEKLDEKSFNENILKVEKDNFKLVGFPFYTKPESKNEYVEKVRNLY